MQDPIEERLQELWQRAAEKQDIEKLLEITAEIQRRAAEKERLKKFESLSRAS
jgi:hypothetical protein